MKFRFVVMNASFKEQKKKHFFICREFFSGKSLCDICLNDPFAILDAMKFNKHALNDILKNDGCIIDELLQGYPEKTVKNCRLVSLREAGTIITCDFNFITQIQRGLLLNCFSSVKILLQLLFEKCNSQRYSHMIMLEIPIILQKMGEDFSCLFGFFHRSMTELDSEDAEYCSIENNIKDLNLPIISDERHEFIYVEDYVNVLKPQDQMVSKIMDREKRKTSDDLTIEIEHKYIDFQYLILGMKIRERQKYVLDDFRLARFMINDQNIEFYQQEYVKKIIDVHFPLTKKFYCVLLIFYIVCFFIPLVATIFSGCGASTEFLTAMYCIQCFAQVCFFSIEMLQLRYLGI